MVRVFGAAAARDLPLTPFSHLLDAWEPTSDPGQVVPGLLRSLAVLGREQGAVLVVDDVQHLDAVSLAVVEQTVKVALLPVVLTRRISDPLPSAIAELVRAELLIVKPLRGLGRAASSQLASSLAEARLDTRTEALMWSTTRGNPLFIRELIAGGREHGWLVNDGDRVRWVVPDPTVDLRRAINDRLAVARFEEQQVLDLLALFEAAPAAILRRGRHGAAVRSLEQRGLIRTEWIGRRETVVFAHPLHAEAVRERLTADHAVAVYRAYLDLLDQGPGRRADDLLQRAIASVRSGGSSDIESLLMAASIAQARVSPSLVLELTEAAQRSAPTLVGAALIGAAHFSNGEFERGLQIFEEAEHLNADEPTLVTFALNWAITILFGTCDVAATRDIVDRFLPRLHSAWRHQLRSASIAIETYHGSIGAALEEMREVLDLPGIPVRARLWIALPSVVALVWAGQVAEAQRLLDWATGVAPALAGEVWAVLAQLDTVAAFCEIASGGGVASLTRSRAKLVDALEQGDVVRSGLITVGLAIGSWLLGQPLAADEVIIRGSGGLWMGARTWQPTNMGFAGAAMARWGRLEDARECASEIDPDDVVGIGRVPIAVLEAELMFAVGDPLGGLRSLAVARSLAVERGERLNAWMIDMRVMGLVGTDEAISTALCSARLLDMPVAAVAAEALGALTDRRWTDAVTIADRLIRDGYRSTGDDLIGVIRRRADPAARSLVAEGARHRDTPAATHGSSAVRLTRAEYRVAGCVGEGMANKQIARELGLSVKTVEFHVTSILRKYDVRRRAELVRVLLANG